MNRAPVQSNGCTWGIDGVFNCVGVKASTLTHHAFTTDFQSPAFTSEGFLQTDNVDPVPPLPQPRPPMAN